MRVYYGFSYLTPKAIRKAELAIYYENSDTNPVKNDEFVKKRIKVVHERRQTEMEMQGCEKATRMFTKYGFFIDDKPFLGNIDKVLDVNYEADKNHVDAEERLMIKQKLRDEYFRFYNRTEVAQRQLKLF